VPPQSMNLLRAAFSVSAMTFLSRITGLAREVLMASTFGAGAATDAFFVAFRIPNMLRRLFAEGAFTQGFVPVLADYRARLGEAAVHELINRTATLLAVALAVVTGMGVLVAPALVFIMTLGFAGDVAKFDLTTALLRWLFPYIFCISLVSLAGGVLNGYGRFKGPAFTPVLLNLAMIVAMLLVAPRLEPAQQIFALAWGATAGGVLQLAFQLPQLRAVQKLPRWDWNPRDTGVVRILSLMGPAVLGVSVAQISLLINTQWAATLGDRAVSWLSYADRLMEFPTALLGVALGVVILPSLARHKADADHTAFSRLVDWGLRLTLLLSLPAAAALVLLAIPLLGTLFWHGQFRIEDVLATRVALWGYAVGLVGIIAVKILAPGFYAQQNVKTPMRIAVVALMITQVLNVVMMTGLRYANVGTVWLHAVLSLTISIGALANSTLLCVFLRRSGLYRPEPGWGLFFAKVALATLVMSFFLGWAIGDGGLSEKSRFFAMGNVGKRVLELAWLVALGGVTYFAALYALGIRWQHFRVQGAS
jgi:putative peptidoglycan lipid II flippase